ncbi:MAG: hypothetical protein WC602_06280 [archaeon]
MATTTIQISKQLKSKLEKRKLSKSESYEEIIWDMLEDSMELSAETIRDIEKSRKQIKMGQKYSLEQIVKELKL